MIVSVWNGKEYTSDFTWTRNSEGMLVSVPVNDYRGISIEEEIVNQETILNYYDTLTISDRATLTASLRTTELTILAREKIERKARNIALGVPNGKTIDAYSASAPSWRPTTQWR